MMEHRTDEISAELGNEEEEQEISESVDANIELEREFYENEEQSFDNYFLADASRNGS